MTTKTVSEKHEEKTVVKGLCFIGVAMDSNTIEVDLKDGRIVRINPLRYDREYGADLLKPWRMQARVNRSAHP